MRDDGPDPFEAGQQEYHLRAPPLARNKAGSGNPDSNAITEGIDRTGFLDVRIGYGQCQERDARQKLQAAFLGLFMNFLEAHGAVRVHEDRLACSASERLVDEPLPVVAAEKKMSDVVDIPRQRGACERERRKRGRFRENYGAALDFMNHAVPCSG
jgi:hypothetical protein